MISAVIDTTQAEIRFAVKDLVDSQFYAIDRCAGAGVRFDFSKYIHFMKPERLTDGDRMSHSGLRLIGSYYYNFAEIFYCFNQIHDAGSGYSIIIGDKDNWFLFARPDSNT